MNFDRVGFIGFGEAGHILASDLAARNIHVQAYDLLLDKHATRQDMEKKADRCGVRLCGSATEAAQDTTLVISAVTAGNALQVARALAPSLRPGQFFMDINSVAPATKQAARDAVEGRGARYIDAAVMAPVPPQRLMTPILLSGQAPTELSVALNSMGFNTREVGSAVGVASAIKMCRSVMIKGLEALTTECLNTARHYGAETEVLASLHASFPSMGWDANLSHYLISRVAEHGRRRAEEMQEVAQTVQAAGVQPSMSLAIAQTQLSLVEAMTERGLEYKELEPFDWQQLHTLLRV